MKKILAVLALALFIGGIAIPAAAAVLDANVSIELMEDDPKKKTTKKASAEKSTTSEKSSSDGQSTEKASDCSESKATKKSDCSKSCGGS